MTVEVPREYVCPLSGEVLSLPSYIEGSGTQRRAQYYSLRETIQNTFRCPFTNKEVSNINSIQFDEDMMKEIEDWCYENDCEDLLDDGEPSSLQEMTDMYRRYFDPISTLYDENSLIKHIQEEYHTNSIKAAIDICPVRLFNECDIHTCIETLLEYGYFEECDTLMCIAEDAYIPDTTTYHTLADNIKTLFQQTKKPYWECFLAMDCDDLQLAIDNGLIHCLSQAIKEGTPYWTGTMTLIERMAENDIVLEKEVLTSKYVIQSLYRFDYARVPTQRQLKLGTYNTFELHRSILVKLLNNAPHMLSKVIEVISQREGLSEWVLFLVVEPNRLKTKIECLGEYSTKEVIRSFIIYWCQNNGYGDCVKLLADTYDAFLNGTKSMLNGEVVHEWLGSNCGWDFLTLTTRTNILSPVLGNIIAEACQS